MNQQESGAGSAFVKGGCGCLGAFMVLALLAVVLGGNASIDVGGMLCLFVVGGVLGLGVFMMYRRGYDDGNGV